MKYHVTIITPQGESSNYILLYLSGLRTCIESTSEIFKCPISALNINITIKE